MREKLLAQHLAIHDAVVAQKPEAAAKAAQAHIDAVVEATRDANNASTRNEVSSLRLEQHQSRKAG